MYTYKYIYIYVCMHTDMYVYLFPTEHFKIKHQKRSN